MNMDKMHSISVVIISIIEFVCVIVNSSYHLRFVLDSETTPQSTIWSVLYQVTTPLVRFPPSLDVIMGGWYDSNSIHLRIGDSGSASFEQKELVLESLVDFCKEPSLIVGLYRNYDCELGSSYLFEDLCKFLAAGAPTARWGLLLQVWIAGVSHDFVLPNRGRPTALSLLCLEGMLGMINSISKVPSYSFNAMVVSLSCLPWINNRDFVPMYLHSSIHQLM